MYQVANAAQDHDIPPTPAAGGGVTARDDIPTEWLPFTVNVVRTAQELKKAVEIRHSAYARHMPEFADTLRAPEKMDLEPGVVIFLAASKVDGSPLGTMRVQTNAFRPLALESSVTLPPHLQSASLAEATRLGITQDRLGRLVKTALFKSFYQYCLFSGIEWMVIAGRSPIDRQYERLMFRDIHPEGGYIPLKHASNIPHRVMSLEVANVEALWRTANHPLYSFFFQTHHPDLETDRNRSNRVQYEQPLPLALALAKSGDVQFG